MALQVWLPLNGSMENQGLLNLTPAQQGIISWIDGKIGKCLSAGQATQTVNGISYDSNLTSELGTEFSAAVWVKPLGNHVHYNGTFVSSGNWNAKRWAFGVNQNNSQVDVFCQGHNTYITCEVPVNTWTHLCCVHQGTTVKLYKNGEYVGEKTGVEEGLESDATNFCVGRETYASGYFSFNGNLNDLRIYNHALSLKEVKELAKGLILHYKLDDFYLSKSENIMPNHLEMALESSSNASTGTWRQAGSNSMTKARVLITDSPEGECYGFQNTGVQTPNDASCYGIDSFPIVGNTTYTISMWARCISGEGAYAGFNVYTSTEKGGSHTGTLKNYKTTPLPGTGEWIKCWYTFTTGSGNTRNIYIGIVTEEISVTTQMCCVHIEKVDNTLDNIVYDTSGYSNNGTIIGILTNSTDTPKYTVSSHIGANATKIHVSGLTTAGFGNSYSFAWWAKTSSKDPMHWGFSDGIRLNGMYTGVLWNTGDSGNNPLYKPGTTTQVTAPSTGIWHHYVMIGNGTKCYVYLDGELWAEAKTYKAISGTSIYINGWDSSASYTSNNVNLSDFRIYATALSAEDVAELYHTAASIDKQGNLFCGEVVE